MENVVGIHVLGMTDASVDEEGGRYREYVDTYTMRTRTEHLPVGEIVRPPVFLAR